MAKHSTTNPGDSNAALESFIKQAREAKVNAAPVLPYTVLEPAERARRFLKSGVGLGFIASLLFALVSQIPNLLMLPGVPMFRSLIDPLMVALQIVIIGTLFSLFSVASMNVQNRVAAAVGLVILFLIFAKFYTDYGTLLGSIMEGIGFLYKFLIPILLILSLPVPFTMLIRWAADAQVKNHYHPLRAPQRAAPAMILFAVAALIASLFIYASPERQAIRAMDALMAEASAARTEEALPYAVRYTWGTPFFPNASGAYHLSAMHNPLPNRVYEDGTPFVMDVSVTAEFESGYWLTCEFVRATGAVKKCASGYTPPFPGQNG